ncbi:hypothetical protein ACQJBY_007158 [Aegilops geniculata]
MERSKDLSVLPPLHTPHSVSLLSRSLLLCLAPLLCSPHPPPHRHAPAASPWCPGAMGLIAAGTPWSTSAQVLTTAELRSLLPLKTPISRDLKRSCLFSAMNIKMPQKGVLLSKESTLAGGFFVVLRSCIAKLGKWIRNNCLVWQHFFPLVWLHC